MIINGKSGCSGAYWSAHLMKTETNERVEIKEMRGLYAEDLSEAFREMRMLAAATKARDYFYQANLNPRADEVLTDEQWEQAADLLEHKLHFDNHPRFIVEHAKVGEDGQVRTHRHIIWSRVNMETNTVVPDDGNYYAHTETARELEQAFNLSPVKLPDPPERDRFKDWETFRGAESGVSPAEMKAEITAIWQHSDGGRAFQAAIEENGYLLAQGDRRDFVLIDPEGDIHSLARRIDGAKAADIRAKMGDLDRDSLMTAQQASAWMKGKDEAENSGSSDARILPQEQAYKQFIDYHRSQFDAPLGSPEYWERIAMQDSDRRAWDAEQARLAEIDRRLEQAQKPAQPEHDPPAGEPPIEAVTFERAARGIDPPQNFSEREPIKRDNETWLELVTRQQQERDKPQGKDKTEEKEPELER